MILMIVKTKYLRKDRVFNLKYIALVSKSSKFSVHAKSLMYLPTIIIKTVWLKKLLV